jgi:hypothetical protein
MNDAWVTTLAAALVVNAVVGFAYPVYRLSRGGPMGDVWGRGILGALLLALAGAVYIAGWGRWVAFAYGLLFAVVVMPIWVLGVLIPMRPGRLDYAFAAVYELTLVVIVLAGLLA